MFMSQGIAQDRPLTYPIQLPADSPKALTLGSVSISTYSPVTITPFENSTNLYFDVRNNGTQRRTVQFTSWDEIVQTHPSWLYHFFRLFGLEANSPYSITVDPGQTRTLEFYVSKDLGGGISLTATLPFGFRVVEDSLQGSLDVTFIADDWIMELFRTQTASIEGRVTNASGAPIAGAIVSAGMIGLQLFGTATTDSNGRYRIGVISAADTRTILGPRRLPYRSLDYFLNVEADGYALAYREGIAPPTNQATTVDVTLQAQTPQPGYRLAGELATNGKLAYWWIRFAGANNDRVVAIQGQHPPVDPQIPGHVIAVDLTGREIWRVPTQTECWGIDVSPDGRLIAVGCHDSNVYVMTQDGQLLYKQALGDRPDPSWPTSHVTDVRFTRDGKKLLVDGGGGELGFTVIDAASGQFLWRSKPSSAGNAPLTAYKARWSSDSQRVVAGGNGPIAMFTADGTLLWENQMGESPLWLEMDDAYNSYAAGKSRELFSWDKNGVLRWRYRLAHTSNEAWKGITADGRFMLMPTFNGILQTLDGSGNVVWQRRAAAPTPTAEADALTLVGTGHNALSMTPTADRIALGTRDWQAQVYARDGTLIWKHVASMRSDFQGDNPDVHGHYTGTTAIAISPDGKTVAAGYADSVIRIFAREPVVTVAKRGSGIGLVASSPAGINCGAACSSGFTTGTAVTLTATTPFPGSIFSQWGGACSGMMTTCTVPANADSTVTATFIYTGSSNAYDYVQKAYIAYYGRPADPEGQAYWAGQMDEQGGSLAAILSPFGNSEEFRQRYGDLNNTQLVTKIYQQALGRDPDLAGLAWYVGELDAGRTTLQRITLDVLNGATVAPDSTVVANKLEVASYFSAKVAAGCAYGRAEDGVALISGVGSTATSVTAAKTTINAKCGT